MINRFSLGNLFVVVWLVAAVIVLIILNPTQGNSIRENSPEVGYARDMMLHHGQAVNMALMLYDRTDNDTLRAIALDMTLTQQTQIGQMQGWLILWDVPFASTELPMTWMGMPTTGLMPGMATDDQLAALRASSGTESDRLFVELMIPHHQSAIQMAEAILERTEHPAVRAMATAIIANQQREIQELQAALLPSN